MQRITHLALQEPQEQQVFAFELINFNNEDSGTTGIAYQYWEVDSNLDFETNLFEISPIEFGYPHLGHWFGDTRYMIINLSFNNYILSIITGSELGISPFVVSHLDSSINL